MRLGCRAPLLAFPGPTLARFALPQALFPHLPQDCGKNSVSTAAGRSFAPAPQSTIAPRPRSSSPPDPGPRHHAVRSSWPAEYPQRFRITSLGLAAPDVKQPPLYPEFPRQCVTSCAVSESANARSLNSRVQRVFLFGFNTPVLSPKQRVSFPCLSLAGRSNRLDARFYCHKKRTQA